MASGYALCAALIKASVQVQTKLSGNHWNRFLNWRGTRIDKRPLRAVLKANAIVSYGFLRQ